MRLLYITVLAFSSMVPLAACGNSESSSGSLVSTCSGTYSCDAPVYVEFQGDLNVLSLASRGDGSCRVNSDVISDGAVSLDADGTLSLMGKAFGTWSGTSSSLQVCIGGVCVSCSDDANANGSTALPPGCQGTWGCDRSLPIFIDDLDNYEFGIGKVTGACSYGDGALQFTSDGKVTANDFPIGTWSGSDEAPSVCFFGNCTTCINENGGAN